MTINLIMFFGSLFVLALFSGLFSLFSTRSLLIVGAGLLTGIWLNGCAPLDTETFCGDKFSQPDNHVIELCFDTQEQCEASGATGCQHYDYWCTEEGRGRVCISGREGKQQCEAWGRIMFENPSPCTKEGT